MKTLEHRVDKGFTFHELATVVAFVGAVGIGGTFVYQGVCELQKYNSAPVVQTANVIEGNLQNVL